MPLWGYDSPISPPRVFSEISGWIAQIGSIRCPPAAPSFFTLNIHLPSYLDPISSLIHCSNFTFSLCPQYLYDPESPRSWIADSKERPSPFLFVNKQWHLDTLYLLYNKNQVDTRSWYKDIQRGLLLAFTADCAGMSWWRRQSWRVKLFYTRENVRLDWWFPNLSNAKLTNLVYILPCTQQYLEYILNGQFF